MACHQLISVAALAEATVKDAASAAKSSDACVSVGAGMMEGADMVIRVDLKGLRESAIYVASRKEKSAEEKAIQDAIVEATGLAEEDFEALLFAVDLDTIDFDAEDMAAEMEKVNGVMALGLKKAVDIDTVVAGLQSVSTNNTMSFETVKTEGRDVVVATSEEEEAPKVYATTAQSGKLVLVSINSPSLLAAAKRADSGKHHPTPKAITKVCAAWSENVQMVAGLVLSDEMKQDLTAHIEAMEKDEQQAMMAGMVARLALKPLWKVMHASACLNSASRCSRAMCRDMVPAMVRTAPGPTPYWSIACRVASRMRG